MGVDSMAKKKNRNRRKQNHLCKNHQGKSNLLGRCQCPATGRYRQLYRRSYQGYTGKDVAIMGGIGLFIFLISILIGFLTA